MPYSDDDDSGPPSRDSPRRAPGVPRRPATAAWACARPHPLGAAPDTPPENLAIIEVLTKLRGQYERDRDKWRTLSTTKAIQAISRHPRKIVTRADALSIRGIGESLATKIAEIIESGTLPRVERNKERDAILEALDGVWGAGPEAAIRWMNLGAKSVADLRDGVIPGLKLNSQQRIGVRYYDEFKQRIPRAEVAEIEATVLEAARTVDPTLRGEACGSYRRGKADCGDVDVMLTTADDDVDAHSLLDRLLTLLRRRGFLTDDLSRGRDGPQSRYMGVCLLPGEGRLHRRLDVIIVPPAEEACALVYFTGSDHLNRSMRLLAKKNNMSLSNRGLYRDVVRAGADKVFEGVRVPTPTERDVFEALGLPYLTPELRNA